MGTIASQQLSEDESELHCPQCKNIDLDIDSSFSMQLSIIKCLDCGFYFEGKCDEETLIKRFKKKFKTDDLAVSKSLTKPKKENVMNKSQLIARITEQAGINKTQATAALQAVETGVIDTLASGGKVELKGFGTFSIKERAERTGRNPQTGEAIQIPAKKAPIFKAGKALKDAVN
nr:MAG TPA: DNA binding protein [Caudoviricetes sp.]